MNLVAQMVGTVVAVVAAPGEQLEEFDPVVIIESMKMELPVTVDVACVVVSVAVREGDIVQEGDVLAVVEPVSS